MFDLDASDFGAKGDGKSDDAGPLQEAINAAAASGYTLHLRQRATYLVSRELSLAADVEIDGHGAQLVTTNEPLRSVLAVSCVASVRRLTVNASLVATHALYLTGGGQSRFEDCRFMRAVKDAVLLAVEGAGNDCVKFERCTFQHSGRIYRAGTVRVTPGVSPLVYGDGTDFTALREGDFLHVGDEWLPVAQVLGPDKVQCALHPPSVGHEAGSAYAAHVGDGLREEPNNETNLSVHRDCLYRGNAGSGYRAAGLFGPRIESAQADFNGAFGFVVGMAAGVNVIGSSFRGCYVEGNGADEAFFLGYAAGIEISTLNCGGAAVRVSNPTFNWGSVTNAQGRQALEAIGGFESNVPSNVVAVHAVLPPAVPNSYPSGTMLFQRCPMPGAPFAWVKFGASPFSEWLPLGGKT